MEMLYLRVPELIMPDSITVVRQTLTLFVLVRIQVGQQKSRSSSFGFFILRSYFLTAPNTSLTST